jgi:hypothetical protein
MNNWTIFYFIPIKKSIFLRRNRFCLVKGAGTLGNEESTVGLGRSLETVRQGESELGSQDLLDVLATDIGILDLGNADDLD